MKRNSMLQAKRRLLTYKSILVIGFLSLSLIPSIEAQRTVKVYEKEIEITENTVIKCTGPKSLRTIGTGNFCTNDNESRFTFSQKSKTPVIFEVDKSMDITTWDKPYVKQVVTITLDCNTPAEKTALFEALEINLRENAAGYVFVNCDMNIEYLDIYNGFFVKDNDRLKLTNGVSYPVKYFKIKNELFIPESSLFSYVSEGETNMGKHVGSVDLDLNDGLFRAKSIQQLKAKITASQLEVDELEYAKINANRSELNIKQIDELDLISKVSVYNLGKVDKLTLSHSLNDQFNANFIDIFSVMNTTFSDFNFENVGQSLDMITKNSDLNIDHFEADLSSLFIRNANAELNMNLNDIPNYTLFVNQTDKNTLNVSEKMRLKSSDSNSRLFAKGEKKDAVKIEIDCNQCDINLY